MNHILSPPSFHLEPWLHFKLSVQNICSAPGASYEALLLQNTVFAMFISTVEVRILNLLLYFILWLDDIFQINKFLYPHVSINCNIIFPMDMIVWYSIQIEIVIWFLRRFIRDRCPVISMHVWFWRVDEDSTILFRVPNHQD